MLLLLCKLNIALGCHLVEGNFVSVFLQRLRLTIDKWFVSYQGCFGMKLAAAYLFLS